MVFKYIFVLYNIIINFFFIKHNMDTKLNVSQKDNDIEKNRSQYCLDNCTIQFLKNNNKSQYCNNCFRVINKDIYCLMDKIYCSNNCRIQFIKKNNIII
jgi:hypothetical protein